MSVLTQPWIEIYRIHTFEKKKAGTSAKPITSGLTPPQSQRFHFKPITAGIFHSLLDLQLLGGTRKQFIGAISYLWQLINTILLPSERMYRGTSTLGHGCGFKHSHAVNTQTAHYGIKWQKWSPWMWNLNREEVSFDSTGMSSTLLFIGESVLLCFLNCVLRQLNHEEWIPPESSVLSGLAWFIPPLTFSRRRLQRLLCSHARCFDSFSNRCKSCLYGSALTRRSMVGNYIPQNRQNEDWDVQEEDVWTLQWWGFDHYRDSLCKGRRDIRVFSKWWTRWPTAPVTSPYPFIYLASLSVASLWMMSSQKLVLSKTKLSETMLGKI